MHWAEAVLTAIASSALFAVLVGFLVKFLLDRKLEEFKQESQLKLEAVKLEGQHNLEEFKAKSNVRQQRMSETLKASLAKESTEHEIRYKKLHERMATVLDELFSKMERSYYHVNNFSSDVEWANASSKEEQHKEAREKVTELSDFARRNWLFIPDSINALVQEYLVQARAINRALKHTLDLEKAGQGSGTNTDAIDADVAKLGAAFTGVRRGLQTLLGFSTQEKTT